MTRARVNTGARLHLGFCNLSLARERLYGGVGLALDAPTATIVAEPATSVTAPDALTQYAERAVGLLGVDGAVVEFQSAIPRHVGLGSGTQHALATVLAIGAAHGRPAPIRVLAPLLGRGGRSGVGVATFEAGGFVVDSGHPTELFTPGRPSNGDWEVPRPIVSLPIPADWRFVLVQPATTPGRNGTNEIESMREVVEAADPAIADELSAILVDRLLPAIADADIVRFGEAAATFDRLNGTWYLDQQEGVYRPPVGDIVERLSRSPAVFGAGQSSWGPTAYGVTHKDRVKAAEEAGSAALTAASLTGSVRIVAPRNDGASLRVSNDSE